MPCYWIWRGPFRGGDTPKMSPKWELTDERFAITLWGG